LATRDIIVIGASTGGIDALCSLVRALPANLPASVFVVMHVGGASALGTILDRCGTLRVVEAHDREKIKRGCVYVAPSDRHLMLNNGQLSLSHGPRENRHRPAVDPLFRSAARTYRQRVIGVILTGALDDGSAGLFAVKNRGGIAIVQDPLDAFEAGMPRSALRSVEVDYCVPLAEIPPLLVRLSRSKVRLSQKDENEKGSKRNMSQSKKPGFRDDAVSFVCPECDGPLYETRQGTLIKFNCQIGHSFSPESLTAAHTDTLERALWIAVRTLNERVAINEALAQKQLELKNTLLAERLAETASSASHDVKLIREILDHL
jgi:two-component system, chemotaxis family, protein-glutamate methylesterase/glutaminase